MYRIFKIILILGILGTAIYFWTTDPEVFSKYRKYLIGGAAIVLLLITSLINDYFYWSRSAKSKGEAEEAIRKTKMYKKR